MADRKRIMIDPSHGGSDPGAVYQGRQEKDDALKLALAVGDILEQKGMEVMYTRVNDVYDSPMDKARMANRSEADYFISIHRNAMPEPGTGSGALMLVYEDSDAAGDLADQISKRLSETGFADLGVSERPDLIILRKTAMPAVMVEAGFIDNEQDNRLFDREFDRIASAIADGIAASAGEDTWSGQEYYQIQTGAFRSREIADRMFSELKSQGFPACLITEDGYYKVRVGVYENLDDAAAMERRLRAAGYSTYVVKHR